MHVSAKDKNTGKENKITIKSDSGLSKEEIERMVQEAEVNAESDKKTRELIETRNMAEAQIHSIRKDLAEVDLPQETKDQVEEAINSVDAAIVTEDKDAITEKLGKLFEAAKPVMEAKAKKEEAKKNETPVDADFTEVN
jgi:molecular chaperone DnaK